MNEYSNELARKEYLEAPGNPQKDHDDLFKNTVDEALLAAIAMEPFKKTSNYGAGKKPPKTDPIAVVNSAHTAKQAS